MKRALLAIAILLGIVCGVSCSKDATNSFIVPSESILLKMPGESGTTDFNSHNITSVVVASSPKGWIVDNIDMYAGTITVTAPSSFDDGEQTDGIVTLTCYTPTGDDRTVEIYVAILPNDDVDYTSAPANCYIANAIKTRYLFNPYIGGTSTPLTTASIALIWETSKNLIKYLDLRDGVASFYVDESLDKDDNPTGEVTPGNALIGGYDADGNLLWSWHIWVTNSSPATDVISLNGHELMNINLGADCNSNADKDHTKILHSYGLYYQWGRRAPFVGPNDWNFYGNEDKRMYDADEDNIYLSYEASSTEIGTTEWGAKHPMTIIKGNPDNEYDWLYSSHDDTLWEEGAKSEQDPCPSGWRVPDSSIYEMLTIAAADDQMNWEEAQPMYGWRLEDTATQQSHFFTAAGRRNYLDGRLDNINDDDFRPVPWSGYYWTSTIDGANAKALYFDLNSKTRTWNAINTSRSMQRANALPIRCVKE